MSSDARKNDAWTVGGRTFGSRLLVGTGKYASTDQAREAIAASGAEIVTVALRRVELDREKPSVLDAVDPTRHTLLPNTAGCYSVDDALRVARLSRELGMDGLVKLEVIGDEKTLYPDNAATVRAAEILVDEGFTVLPYCTADVVVCKQLAAVGCAAVMPLASPIGSGLGILNPHMIKLILEAVDVPVIVDAGVGTASDAAVAMELGCDAVLMNTGIAAAKDPVVMAEAMREAISAGRKAYLAGRMPRRAYATASSPDAGRINA